MTEREWGNAIDSIRLPREIYIAYKELKAVAELEGERISGGLNGEVFWNVLFKECCLILIADNPDFAQVETPEMMHYLSTSDVTPLDYAQFRRRFVEAMKRPLNDIERLRSVWREHANPHLAWKLSDDQCLVIIKFTPVYPTRDYDGILRNTVKEAIANGEFVPYKYLRVLGLC